MNDSELKKMTDEIYAIGFKNGQIEMRNNILKKINRDKKLVYLQKPMAVLVRVMQIIDKISLSAPTLSDSNLE